MSNRTATWLPLYGDVFSNAKVATAARSLTRGNAYTMVGHLAALWLWSLEFAQDGDLGHLTDRTIAHAAGWSGKADKFVATLLESGLLEPDRRIHDWNWYAGRLIGKRKKDAARKRAEYEAKKKTSSPAETPRDIRTHSDQTVTVPHRTVIERQSDSLAPFSFSSDDARVMDAVGQIVTIRATRVGLYDCVLARSEAQAIVLQLLADHDAALVFAAIQALHDVSEGFESNTRAGQTSGIISWVGRQKPPLLDTVRDLLAQVGEPQELLDEAGIPEDGVGHATTESLHHLHDLLRQRPVNRGQRSGGFEW